MPRFDGSLARKLDFGEFAITTSTASAAGRTGLRLAPARAVLRGPDKYKVLDHRRRQAQIKARRQLDLLD